MFGVLSTIQFNHQPPFQANKVHKIRTKRLLPSELVTFEAAITEMPPQCPFEHCGVPSEFTRTVGFIYLKPLSFTLTLFAHVVRS